MYNVVSSAGLSAIAILFVVFNLAFLVVVPWLTIKYWARYISACIRQGKRIVEAAHRLVTTFVRVFVMIRALLGMVRAYWKLQQAKKSGKPGRTAAAAATAWRNRKRGQVYGVRHHNRSLCTQKQPRIAALEVLNSNWQEWLSNENPSKGGHPSMA